MTKAPVTEFTLNAGLIECGFTFGNRFREFFRKQTGEENFRESDMKKEYSHDLFGKYKEDIVLCSD